MKRISILFLFISVLVGQLTFTEHSISLSANAVTSVYAVDIDSDGDMDVLSASGDDDKIAWYENDGSESFTEHVISDSADNAIAVYATDMDGDADMDVLSASRKDDKIAWYENDGSESFTEHVISDSANFPRSVFSVDMDSDGDMDVLSGSVQDNKIAWYENDGSESFIEHVISDSSDDVYTVYASDMDSDGDMDVLSALGDGDKIVWYANDGNQSFTEKIISSSVDYGRDVYAADVDGDGDMDALSASSKNDKISWHENDGNESFTEHIISSSANFARAVFSVDMDFDEDMDILSASRDDNKIAWYENDGSESFTLHVISDSADNAISVYAADMDGDGDMDVLSASKDDDKVAWYENSKVNAPGDNIAPAILWSPVDGSTDVPVASNVTITLNELVRNIDNTDLTNTNVDGLITLKSDDANGSDIAFDATVVVGGTGSALSFDGINDYVRVTIDTDLPLNNIARTMSAWIYDAGDDNSWGSVMHWGGPEHCSGYMWGFGIRSGKLTLWGGCKDWITSLDIPKNEWTFISATYDGSKLRAWVNGVKDSTSASNYQTSTSDLFIGGETTNNGISFRQFFYGKIDDVSIWDEALNDGEVAAIYGGVTPTSNSGSYTSSSNLVGYWNFNEGSGSIVSDGSGTGNSGAISGATWTTWAVDGNTVITIDPANNFVSNQTVYAAIGATLEDFSDNVNTASSITFSTAFLNVAPLPFDLVYPYDDMTIVLTRDNFLDTLYFAWNESVDPNGDIVAYRRELTGDLHNYIRFIGTSDNNNSTTNMYKVPYHHIEHYMHTAGVELISGTWTIVATDAKYNVYAENGPFTLTIDGVRLNINDNDLIPDEFALYANYPNPFNPTTTISYDLPEQAQVTLGIYDLLGKKIKTLVNQPQDAGVKTALWDGTDNLGRQVSAGVYLYQILAGGEFSQTRKMLLLK